VHAGGGQNTFPHASTTHPAFAVPAAPPINTAIAIVRIRIVFAVVFMSISQVRGIDLKQLSAWSRPTNDSPATLGEIRESELALTIGQF
jgi:hypothetical protein